MNPGISITKPTVMKKMQLSIPEPCHEKWESMAPTEQGRYCNACAKQVIDFTSMSNTELLNYFSKLKNESVCGRAYTDQLDRDITMPPKKKWLWYCNYIIAFFILFSKTNNAKAQDKIKTIKTVANKTPETTTKIDNTTRNNINFKGKVTDEKGNPVSFASIRITGTRIGTSTDSDGNFSLQTTSSSGAVEVSAVGFNTTKLMLNRAEGNNITLKTSTVLLQGVVVNTTSSYRVGKLTCRVGGVSYRRKISVRDTLKNWITFNPSIKIYPNPVQKGNSFTAELKVKNTGVHQIQVFDATGRLLLQKEITVNVKQHKELIATNSSWASGIYFIHVFNDKKKIANSSFVVE